jgi:hypothetical protein
MCERAARFEYFKLVLVAHAPPARIFFMKQENSPIGLILIKETKNYVQRGKDGKKGKTLC